MAFYKYIRRLAVCSLAKINKQGKNKKSLALVSIIFIATILRVAFLDSNPIVGDEPFYYYRSLGFVDLMVSESQQTPFDWLEQVPFLGRLSFHDHPLFTFIIHHLFFRIFGDSVFIARLPSALFGIGQVILLYFLAKELFNKKNIAIIVAFCAATDIFLVFFSRLIYMESITMFLITLGILLFFYAQKNNKLLVPWGIVVGLSILAKYVAFIMLPIYGLTILFYKREWLRNKHFYLGILAIFVFLIPIILYNAWFFKLTGHFDLQIASLLGQSTPEWTTLLGKTNRGSLGIRLLEITHIGQYTSPLLFVIIFSGIILLILQIYQKRKASIQTFFLLITILFFCIFYLLIGSSARFLVYLMPILCIVAGWTLWQFYFISKKYTKYFLIFFVFYQIFFTANTLFPVVSYGAEHITYLPALKVEERGVLQLDKYIRENTKNKISGINLTSKNSYVNSIMVKHKKKQVGDYSKEIFIVDSNIDTIAGVWVFGTQQLYYGWPSWTMDQFFSSIQKPINNLGNDVVYHYIINESENSSLEEALKTLDVSKKEIKNRVGKTVYNIYTFDYSVLSRIFLNP